MNATDILWIKSVVDIAVNVVFVYCGQDPRKSHHYRDPSSVGDHFDLHCSDQARHSLETPDVGDLIVLTQHGVLTHIVEVVSPTVVARPTSTMLPGTRDHKYEWQRECRVTKLSTTNPRKTDRVLGRQVNYGGGYVHSLDTLLGSSGGASQLANVQAAILGAFP